MNAPTLPGLGFLLMVGSALGTFACLYFLVREMLQPGQWGHYWVYRYLGYLERESRLLFLDTDPMKTLLGQAVALLMVFSLGIVEWLDVSLVVVLTVGIALLPALMFLQKRAERTKKLEEQVDGMLLAYGNALKAIPSPNAALLSIIPILPIPIKEEVDYVMKEVRVGSSLEQGIRRMAERARSRTVDDALSTILIGMHVGGDLPRLLADSAAALRELHRLEGVLKSKTSEGRAQMWLFAFAPFGIYLAFNMTSPGFFDPLSVSFAGKIIVGIAGVCWLGSIFLARAILSVDQ